VILRNCHKSTAHITLVVHVTCTAEMLLASQRRRLTSARRLFNIMNCVSAGHLKTIMVTVYIDMDPGMWWMLLLHTRNASKLATLSHHVYYADIQTISMYQIIERTSTPTFMCVPIVFPYRDVRVRYYIRDHIILRQSMYDPMFGIGAQHRPSGGGGVNLHTVGGGLSWHMSDFSFTSCFCFTIWTPLEGMDAHWC
jgi:hypothetical protein